MNIRGVHENLRKCELDLLRPDVRKSIATLNRLLHKDFMEFSSTAVAYSRKGIIKALLEESMDIMWTLSKFQTYAIAKNIVLATYVAKKKNKRSGDIMLSLRSSIWKQELGAWKMIFNQGTIIP
jgi:hypothetical protein